jgi:hypothetical protein
MDHLDYSSHNQRRLSLPELEKLADRHCALHPPIPRERYVRIKRLLRDALDTMHVDSASDADLIRGVFFGDFADRVSAPPRELFEQTMRTFRAQKPDLFRKHVDQAVLDFAHFLPDFVRREDAKQAAQPPQAGGEHPPPAAAARIPHWIDAEVGAAADAEAGTVLIGNVNQRQRFTELLALARSVTIIGSTNEALAHILDQALKRMREMRGDAGAFWREIRVVFLDDALLNYLSDERPTAPDRSEARRQRQISATYGRRSVSAFLRRNSEGRWQIFESPAFPPVVGTLFELPTGERLVHLLVRRPTRDGSEAMYVEFADTARQYFSGVFEDVVRRCVNDNKTVPIGVPHDGAFHVQRRQYRDRILQGGSGATGWVPQVLIITWQLRDGAAEPLLQFRRPGIAAKYHLDTLSHPVGTMLESDLAPGPETSQQAVASGQVIRLHDQSPRIAAMRRLRVETGDDRPGELYPLDTGGYLNHDMEHLYFFIFTCEFPDEYQFPGRSEIYRVPLPELVSIRNYQVLRKAALLCSLEDPLPERIRADAFEIASLNLLLHGHADLGARVAEAGSRPPRDTGEAHLAADLARLEEIAKPKPWVSGGRDVELRGLAGFHYREFFSQLLPVYAEIRVPEAKELLVEINQDPARLSAVSRLAALYHSQQAIPHMSVEL